MEKIEKKRIELCKERRLRAKECFSDGALIVPAQIESVRNSDVYHAYRQDSNLFYLTGFEEPESVLVLLPGAEKETIMFVREKDRQRETWDGFRYGVEGTGENFSIDCVYPISDFEKEMPRLLKGVQKIYYSLFKNDSFDLRVRNVLQKIKEISGRSGSGLLLIEDPSEKLGQMRLYKTDDEIKIQKKACQISVEAHKVAMSFCRPGVNERQVEAVLIHTMMMKGSQRTGYPSIVASGKSATTLHYTFNDQECLNGDLLLIDAGAEYQYYTGDITRTFPVNGKFTSAQKEVYQGVLSVQKKIIELCRPGESINHLKEVSVDMLIDVMLDLKLLSGKKEEIKKSGAYRKYYPHDSGHYLGMDVHDVGLYVEAEGAPVCFKENVCFTVEPGIYIPGDDESAPKELRGIGVRIEDNIRITRDGFENMTEALPKEIPEIESIVGEGINKI